VAEGCFIFVEEVLADQGGNSFIIPTRSGTVPQYSRKARAGCSQWVAGAWSPPGSFVCPLAIFGLLEQILDYVPKFRSQSSANQNSEN